MKNKKADTRALDLLISIPAIALFLILFYVFLGQSTFEKQTSTINGNIVLGNADETIAKLIYEKPAIFSNSEKLQTEITNELAKNYKVDRVKCEKDKIMKCEFQIETGKKAKYKKNYQRTSYLPELEIRITGVVIHE